ncbi:cell division protein FtsZ [Bergeyella sp. RCAD1439]|uniref:cell division protein FtsZ n=1 Tax=Bergeyella anatis TaxID=3113737 RepID=UPI002E193B2D|nr:cell division protein FtsZ [Bergeyella sp. RCAD1439]
MENTSSQGFTFDLPKGNSSIIKVIGVGGGGNNALMHMYEKGIHGVDFIICNTDAQTLDNNPVANKVQLGVSTTEGLGAGADPEVGEKAAIESIDDIKASLGQNTKMVFITAGMGGGTGTGAAPVIAKIAKEMGILTVGIVTVPFSFEGRRRLDQADAGLEKLRNNVDSLIVINNDKLRQQFGNLGFKQGFAKADEVLTNAAKGMAEVITAPFTINIDFRDAKSVLQNSGTALMSTGIATGEKRAEEAVKRALDSPLLNDNKITGAKDVLLLIQSGSDEKAEATMDEIGLINDYIQQEAGNTANIIFGVGTDDELGDAIKVLVIATGFAKEDKIHTGITEKIKYTLDQPLNETKESPFKTKAEREEINQAASGKNVFRLDDDEDLNDPTPQFAVKTTEKSIKAETAIAAESFAPNTEETAFADYSSQEPDLFSYGDFEDDLEAQSFSFETEAIEPLAEEKNEEKSYFSEEKPVEFNFVLNEKPKEDLQTLPKEEPVEKFVADTPVNTVEEVRPSLFQTQESALTETAGTTKEEETFTYVSKPSNSEKVNERRNKLKEFNSRYQVFDEADDFENVPAFRRKNIAINDYTASEQNISSFLSEKEGRMELKENRFLNKDVD